MNIPSVSERLLNFFPFLRSGRACQTLFLKFLRNGPADFRDEFAYGGTSNHSVQPH